MSGPLTPFKAPAALALLLSVLMGVSPVLISAQTAPQAAAPIQPAAKPAVPPAKPADAGKELVAVMDLEAVGATKVEASAITDRLREELLKSGKFTLVDRSQISAVLEEQALQQTGCTTQECAVKVGKVLGVRKLINGKVTKISDTAWLVNATVVDVETSETLRAESLRYRGDYFSMLDEAIAQLALKLGTPAGQKPDLGTYVAAQQVAQPPAKAAAPPEDKKDESKGISGWWWVAGGAAVLGIAAASTTSKKSSSSSASGCGNCGNVNLQW